MQKESGGLKNQSSARRFTGGMLYLRFRDIWRISLYPSPHVVYEIYLERTIAGVSRMLHIHNGDASANVLRQSALPGEHLPWREALIAGPAPHGLSLEEWCDVRAGYLAHAYGVDATTCRNDLLDQERKLKETAGQDEVVLWFEHDLFCQTILIYLLQRLGSMNLPEQKVSLICIDRFPGKRNFRGLGELTPEQMASLFEGRVPVSRAQFDLAHHAWLAYTSPNPTDIEMLLKEETSQLPFLAPALRAHLRRFPSTRNGLGAVQNRALELIGERSIRFSSLFRQFGSAEPLYGYGDYQFWNDLRALAAMHQPLVAVEGLDAPEHPVASGTFGSSSFRLTTTGERVIAGEEDAFAIGGLDLWLGGVHLAGTGRWRWDPAEGNLVSVH